MKYRIENIPLKDYIYLDENTRLKYDFAIKYGVFEGEKDIYKIGDLTKRSFGFVKDLQHLYESDKLNSVEFFDELNKILCENLTITEKYIYETHVFSYFNFLQYLSKMLGNIQKIEKSLITITLDDNPKPSSKRFEKYSYMIQIDSLAGGDVLKYDEVRKIEYNVAFAKLLYEKDKHDYNEEYREMIKRKNKTQ